MPQGHNSKILATLGPASASAKMIRALCEAGADVFRLNFSHGTHAEQAGRYRQIREVERELGRPIGVLMDLQGPKLRLGRFRDGRVELASGAAFRLDLGDEPGDESRAPMPHPEIFAALSPGDELLLDDGKVRLRAERVGEDFAETRVLVGGALSDRKGVNLPGAVLPISALTEKDRADLAFGLELGADWVALSFVQRPEDIDEARALIGDRARIMAKLEKPAAIEQLDEIVERADGVMVARGDLGVELPPERVPIIQRRILAACRRLGRPSVVATQMLESMIHSPVPTRAEASDVATAVYDGSDAVMLSAESAAGDFPLEAVSTMRRVIAEVESDPAYRAGLVAGRDAEVAPTKPNALCGALHRVSEVLKPVATVTYTASGSTCLRAARERPETPILALTPSQRVARQLSLVWGVTARVDDDVSRVSEMIERACAAARAQGMAASGDDLAIIAGLPFGESGSTNLLHLATLD